MMSGSWNIKRDFKSTESDKEISKTALKHATDPSPSIICPTWFCFRVNLTNLEFTLSSLVPIMMTSTGDTNISGVPG